MPTNFKNNYLGLPKAEAINEHLGIYFEKRFLKKY